MIRVLVVDDSAYMRHLLSRLITAEGDFEVVGTAEDPYDAREKIKQLEPDAITLDIEMPKMDGLSFLRNLMRLHPMPVVLVSSLIGPRVDVAVEALSIGAVDVLGKPSGGETAVLAFAEQLREKLRVAASLTTDRLLCGAARQGAGAPAPLPGLNLADKTVRRVVAIGASTGGTTAIKEIMRELPADFPPILIAQHIPEKFSAAFASSTDRMSAIHVVEAEDGQPVQHGCAYVAPGGRHLELVSDHAQGYRCRIHDGQRVNGHRPSVDVMFDAMTAAMGKRMLGVLLTGMGNDGAHGLARMREAGAYTVAQDEATSVVWGMPGEAVKLDAARKVLPLQRIAGFMVDWARQSHTQRGVDATALKAGEG